MANVIVKWRDINSSSVPNQFRIYRSTAPMDTGNLPAPLVEGLAKSTREYNDTTVVEGQTYYYIVAAYTNTTESLGEEQVFVAGPSIHVGSSDDVYKYAPGQTLNAIDSTATISPEMSGVYALEVDHLGNIYIGDNNGQLMKTDYQGNKLWKVQPSAAVDIYAIALDANDNVYCGGIGENFIYMYDSAGTLVKSFSPATSYRYASYMEVDAQGMLVCIFVDGTGARPVLARIDPSTEEVQWHFYVNSSASAQPMGLALDPNMNIYMAYSYNSSSDYTDVIKYDAAGTQLWTARISASYGGSYRQRIAIDTKNNKLFCVEGQGSDIDIYDLDGNLVQADAGAGQGVVTDNQGNWYTVHGTTINKYDSTNALVASWTPEVTHEQYMAVPPGRYVVHNNLA